MAKVLTDESNYEDIADAIREKNGSSDAYLPSEMAGAVRNIPTGGAVQSVNGKTGTVVLDAADVGAKAVQTEKSSPSASGTAVEFIDTISQDAQGVITATKKTVREATLSQSGLMSAADKTKLNGIESGAQVNVITGVKGNSESSYRTGNVNITPANIGAKAVQTPVSDPSSSEVETSFFDFISNIAQDAQGVIHATKKSILAANSTRAGVMSSQQAGELIRAADGVSAAQSNFAPSADFSGAYPIKAGTLFTYRLLSNAGQYLHRALVDIASLSEVSDETCEPVKVSDLYNELLASILAAYPTDSAEGRMASFSDGGDNLPVKDLVIGIEPVQSGSGDPSPSNVRPISGWTGATVKRCGKNLLNPADAEIGRAWNGASASNRARLVIPCMPNTTYTISATGVSTLSNIYVTNTASVPASSAGADITSRMPFTMTTKADAKYIVVAFSKENIAQEDIDALNLQIELGSDATEYEPYQGSTLSIAFPSEAGTVYGGTLDVTRGVLTVDRIMITIDGSTDSRLASFNTSDANVNRVQCNIYNGIGVANVAFDACDRFEPITPTTTSSLYKVWNSPTAPRMFFGLPKTVTTLDEAKAWFASNPTHIVARIATPQTYQLDPVEVLTLLGANTIYADTGDTTVTYRADPTLAAFVQDVQINGNSILNNGVANVPIASSSSPGVVKVGSGLQVGSSNELKTNPATSADIKAGTDANKPLAPSLQHAAAFYGLAKAAGDTSQSQSANSVGTYTDEAKAAVQRMLGLYNRGELIADVTTTEDATEIVVDTDLSGQAFRLAKLIAIFSAGPSTTGARDSFFGQFVGFDENSIQKTMSFPSMQYASATSAMWAKITLRVEPGMPITCEAIIATSEGNTQNVQGMAKEICIEYITRFRIYQSGSNKSLIPAGTNLKVYGVRA